MSMAERPDRPARTKPVPTDDEGVDPIEYRPAQPAATPSAVPASAAVTADAVVPPEDPTGTSGVVGTQPVLRGRELTVQLAARVSPDVTDLVDRAAAMTGRSKRDLVEDAIRNAPWRT
ncbi:ribbon-helix-helix protein, CopG family [Microbacterium rhizomatis]|uniref:Ribbon-helix-helix protein, CopG family n=2 Tax=Microbacterium rhizomatis TaxID=1631477 RepID=A0A5J5IWZ0_9MICO|nr:ribbon-helix-helix protein, CopG family [Microbacterium rhizomatis]